MPRAQQSQSKAVVAEREARALDLAQRGHTQTEIAQALGVDQGTVSRILDRVYRRAVKGMDDFVLGLKLQQTHELQWVISQAFRGWESSKKKAVRVRRKTAEQAPGGGGGASDPAELVQDVIERDGDPRFLHTAMSAQDRIRSLWGLDVAAADQEAATTIAALAKDLSERGAKYAARRSAEGPAGHPGGAGGPAGEGAGALPG